MSLRPAENFYNSTTSIGTAKNHQMKWRGGGLLSPTSTHHTTASSMLAEKEWTPVRQQSAPGVGGSAAFRAGASPSPSRPGNNQPESSLAQHVNIFNRGANKGQQRSPRIGVGGNIRIKGPPAHWNRTNGSAGGTSTTNLRPESPQYHAARTGRGPRAPYPFSTSPRTTSTVKLPNQQMLCSDTTNSLHTNSVQQYGGHRISSMYGTFGISKRPATAPPAGIIAMLPDSPRHSASHSTLAQRCAGDVDHATIAALSKQFTDELDARLEERKELQADMDEMRNTLRQNDSVVQRRRAQLERALRQISDIEQKCKATELENLSRRTTLKGLVRDNEKIAGELEEMTQLFAKLAHAGRAHSLADQEVKDAIAAARRDLRQTRQQIDSMRDEALKSKAASKAVEQRLADAAKRKDLLNFVISDVFLATNM